MASINMCERCGAFGLSSAIATIVHHASPHAQTHHGEYCPKCYAEFIAWLTAISPEIAGTAFREPYSEAKELGSAN